MPRRIVQFAFFEEFTLQIAAPNAMAQIRRSNRVRSVVKSRLRVWPLRARVQELKRVVVEFGEQGQPAREPAGSEELDCLGPGDLVDVGDDNDVALVGDLGALESGKHLGEHGVALEVLIVPGDFWCEVVGELELVVYEFFVVLFEPVPVRLDGQVLGPPLEGACRFDNDEVVDVVVQRLEPQLHEIELAVDHEQVVHLAGGAGVGGGGGSGRRERERRIAVGTAEFGERAAARIVGRGGFLWW